MTRDQYVQGALDDAGTPTCWGSDDTYFANPRGYKQMTPTDSGFTAMVCGLDHCCVLDADGYPTCWGGDYTVAVEPPIEQFAKLSAEYNYTCGVLLDGSEVDCWGYGGGGIIAAPDGDPWAAYYSGEAFGCGLTVSGNIVCEGGGISEAPDAP